MRVVDDAHEVLDVELHPLHFLGQMDEQFRIHRLLRIVNVGHRLRDALAESTLPHAVGDRHGETWVGRVGGPFGESRTVFFSGLQLLFVGSQIFVVLAPHDEFGLHRIIGLRIWVLVVMRQLHVVGGHVANDEAVGAHVVLDAVADALDVHAALGHHLFDFGHQIFHRVRCHHAGAFLAFFAVFRRAHVGGGGTEEGGHFIELVLGPVGEGVVMALGAGHVGAQEHGERVG